MIRGDCPRCGLLVKRDARSLISDDSESIPKAEASEVYGARTPATWKRRILASMHTLTIFLTAYLLFFFIFIFLILPPDQIFRTLAREFLSTVLAAFPMAIISLTVFVVSFVLPLVTGGRSWGQQLTNIGVLYAGETRMGGLQLALALRAGAILMVSLMPGLIAVRIGRLAGLAYRALGYRHRNVCRRVSSGGYCHGFMSFPERTGEACSIWWETQYKWKKSR